MEKGPGVYGKLPAHGDFIGRRLSNEFVQVWDDWLQRSIAISREQLGEQWLEIYLTSPIWRFVLSAGIVDDGVWAGVVMPSVDQVGRYFPLTIALRVEPLTSPHGVMNRGSEWFNQIERGALDALQEGHSVEQLDDQLQECDQPQWPKIKLNQDRRVPWIASLANEAAQPSSSYPALMDALLEQQFPTYSLWWSKGSHRVPPSFLMAPGLPLANSFAALMDGHFEHWQWHSPYQIMTGPGSKSAGQSGTGV